MITLLLTAIDTTKQVIDSANAAKTVLTTAPPELHFIDLLFKGGWVMLPLALLAFLGLVIFIERYLTIRKSSKDETNLMFQIKQNIHEGRLDSAIALCKNTKSPLARMLEKGLKRIGRPIKDIEGTISGGLYTKMITSATGLIIGIVAYVLYHILNMMVEKIILKMETDAIEFIDLLEEPGK